jgi:RNA polymerase sigma-70 factor (ECF subfamily)
MASWGLESGGDRFAGCRSVYAELYLKSGGSQFGLDRSSFDSLLEEIQQRYLPAGASADESRDFCRSLRVSELVLARGCAAGNERAWEEFLSRYREKIYAIAGYIAKPSSVARELADTLYADLYGTGAGEGQRVSKLASYSGRGSLEGWLRTVLAQQYVNRYRREYRLVSLDEQAEAGSQFVSPSAPPTVAIDQRLELAIDGALAASSAEERFLLAAYYLDGRTLFEIGELLAVHESTISRRLEKLAKELRKRILANLGQRGMSRRQALEALDVDVRDVRLDIRRRLTQESEMSPFS